MSIQKISFAQPRALNRTTTLNNKKSDISANHTTTNNEVKSFASIPYSVAFCGYVHGFSPTTPNAPRLMALLSDELDIEELIANADETAIKTLGNKRCRPQPPSESLECNEPSSYLTGEYTISRPRSGNMSYEIELGKIAEKLNINVFDSYPPIDDTIEDLESVKRECTEAYEYAIANNFETRVVDNTIQVFEQQGDEVIMKELDVYNGRAHYASITTFRNNGQIIEHKYPDCTVTINKETGVMTDSYKAREATVTKDGSVTIEERMPYGYNLETFDKHSGITNSYYTSCDNTIVTKEQFNTARQLIESITTKKGPNNELITTKITPIYGKETTCEYEEVVVDERGKVKDYKKENFVFSAEKLFVPQNRA